MEYITACYWQKEAIPRVFLALQQRKYHRQKISVISACISDSRKLLMKLQNLMEEELRGTDIWKPRTEEKIRERWREYLKALEPDSNYAGILCVDSRVVLFDHGRMNICGFFRRFGRNAWKIWKEQCMVGEVEAGTAILLADHAFLNFCERELAECLRPGSVEAEITLSGREERAWKRLTELGQKAQQQGGIHMGAVWILPVREGESYGTKRNGKGKTDIVGTRIPHTDNGRRR